MVAMGSSCKPHTILISTGKHSRPQGRLIWSYLILSNLIWFYLILSDLVWSYLALSDLFDKKEMLEWKFLFDRSEGKKRRKFNKERKEVMISSSFSSAIWFCWSSLFQEACEDLQPRSYSGRIITGCWWAAIYIIIASYTASLGSMLISSGLVAEIDNIVDLGNQEKVKYGIQFIQLDKLSMQNGGGPPSETQNNGSLKYKKPSNIFLKSRNDGKNWIW